MKSLLNKTIKGGILALIIGVAGLFAAPAQAITIDFGSGSHTDPSVYTEANLTVVSQYPSSSRHLHLHSGNPGRALYNHRNCCSTPYLLTFDMPVNLISVDFKGTGANTFTSNIGSPASLPGTNAWQTLLFVNASNPSDWLGITSILWAQTSGNLRIDNLVYDIANVAPIPEPSTLLLLGSGLAGIVGWRYRKQQQA